MGQGYDGGPLRSSRIVAVERNSTARTGEPGAGFFGAPNNNSARHGARASRPRHPRTKHWCGGPVPGWRGTGDTLLCSQRKKTTDRHRSTRIFSRTSVRPICEDLCRSVVQCSPGCFAIFEPRTVTNLSSVFSRFVRIGVDSWFLSEENEE